MTRLSAMLSVHVRREGRRGFPVVLGAVALLLPAAAGAQDLGHKLLGTIGLDAGSQAAPGLYAADRGCYYGANQARDRAGKLLPLEGFNLAAFANGVGVSGTLKLSGTYLSASVGVPLAHVTMNSDRPEVSIDKFGLADVYVKPLQLGWKLPWLDVVTSYALYVPTGRFEPGGQDGVSSGQLTHEISAGGTLSVNRERTWFLSMLASYDRNQRKLGIDITRGDTVQLQGGLGGRLFGILDVGLAGYAQWQVRDDRGADLPPALIGARDQAYGLGPEIAFTLRKPGLRLGLRYERDIAVKSRPEGQILVLGVSFVAWRPAAPRPEPPASLK